MSEVKLGDISFITKLAGFEHTKYIQGNNTHEKISEDDVPLFIGKTVQNGKIDKNFDWYIPKELSNQLERSKLNKKCLVLPYVGSVGDLAIFDASYDAHLGSNIAKIELAENCGYSEEFIYYFLKSDYGQKILLRDIQGAIQKNITMKAIREVSLPDISIQEQNNIVSILKGLDDKIQINNQINQELEAMAKTLYDYWFVQFDFPDQNGKPYKSSGGKMVYNPELKREIPEGWGVESVGNLLDKVTKAEKIENNSIEFIGEIPVIDQSQKFIAGFTNNENALLQAQDGHVIFGDHTRVVKYINFDYARGADGTQVLISNNENISNVLLYHMIEDFDLSNYGYARHFKFLKEKTVIVPDKEVSSKFETQANVIYEKIKNNIFENQELTQLRDWLLPMLMNGQVKVE